MSTVHGHTRRAPQREQRRFPRYETPSASSSIDFGKLIEVCVHDVSLGGMSFETAKRPGVGRSYLVRLQLGPEKLTVRGKVVWCHLAATKQGRSGEVEPIYRAGLRFEPALAHEMEPLLQRLEQLAFLSANETAGA